MRRVLATFVVLAFCATFAVLGVGAGDSSSSDKPEYNVVFDNAFGLIEGGDLKIAGVRAGKITDLKLDRETNRAVVSFQVTKTGFGSLRTDAHCDSRPQSLIGEYFVDCQPGLAKTELADGATIPVTHTTSTVGPDLVNDVLRRPYRERLALIINELGAGVAGNAQNLNDAIRRGAPALRETDKVLAILAKQNKVLGKLTGDADKVIGAMADNRADVGRWVDETRGAAVTSATRAKQIAEGFRRLPAFLEQLRPTMAALGATASAQTPALRDLSASADQLKDLFENLGGYSTANVPAFKELGKASAQGNRAAIAGVPVVSELRRFTRGLPELGKNLNIILKHLDDPAYAIEDDPRAARASGRPAPTGYTGLEALLQFVYDQAQATNIYDQNSHILKIAIVPPTDKCANYADAARAKEVKADCASWLGPNQPGVTSDDPSATPTKTRKTKSKKTGAKAPAITGPTTTEQAPAEAAKPKPNEIDLSKIIPGLPPIKLPTGLNEILGGLGGIFGDLRTHGAEQARNDKAAKSLLDYLLR